LPVRGSEIHTVSGDAIPFAPGRNCPGWDDIVVEETRMWHEPLAAPENGLPAGTVAGENAIDTKTCDTAGSPRSRLTVVNSAAWGWQNGLISNMAAFNIKENVDAVFDRVTVFDSEIGFRLRGPGSRAGALVRLQNVVVYDSDTAVRYEDDIDGLRIYSSTFGGGLGAAFDEASAPNTVIDAKNLLFLGSSLPGEASGEPSNLAVDAAAFVNATAHDYHLATDSPAIDTGEAIALVTVDRDGVARPRGAEYDVGAYEFCEEGCTGAGGAVGTGGSGGADGAAGAGGAADSGAAGRGAESGIGGASSGGGPNGAGMDGSPGASGGAPGWAAGGPAMASSSDDGGCGCRTASGARRVPWLSGSLVALLAFAGRRRAVRIRR
jgi:hypothetical protein